eukprot:gene21414-32933_t
MPVSQRPGSLGSAPPVKVPQSAPSSTEPAYAYQPPAKPPLKTGGGPPPPGRGSGSAPPQSYPLYSKPLPKSDAPPPYAAASPAPSRRPVKASVGGVSPASTPPLSYAPPPPSSRPPLKTSVQPPPRVSPDSTPPQSYAVPAESSPKKSRRRYEPPSGGERPMKTQPGQLGQVWYPVDSDRVIPLVSVHYPCDAPGRYAPQEDAVDPGQREAAFGGGVSRAAERPRKLAEALVSGVLCVDNLELRRVPAHAMGMLEDNARRDIAKLFGVAPERTTVHLEHGEGFGVRYRIAVSADDPPAEQVAARGFAAMTTRGARLSEAEAAYRQLTGDFVYALVDSQRSTRPLASDHASVSPRSPRRVGAVAPPSYIPVRHFDSWQTQTKSAQRVPSFPQPSHVSALPCDDPNTSCFKVCFPDSGKSANSCTFDLLDHPRRGIPYPTFVATAAAMIQPSLATLDDHPPAFQDSGTIPITVITGGP